MTIPDVVQVESQTIIGLKELLNELLVNTKDKQLIAKTCLALAQLDRVLPNV
jgi:hypothetical protein